MTLLQAFQVGGITLCVLLLCSLLSIATIVERLLYYRKRSKVKRAGFMCDIRKELQDKNIARAIAICKNTDTPFSNVVLSGLNLVGHSDVVISNTMEREIAIETSRLERYTSIVGTIGSTAVYIGLFGTVLGIIKAFRDISLSTAGGMNIVINGISEALVTTAAGLIVAVPAVIAYNYFIKKIDSFITDMELCASETLDVITVKEK